MPKQCSPWTSNDPWHSVRLATVAASAGTLQGRTDVWAKHHLQSISQQLFAIPQHFFSEPKDIVAHPQLSREMKLALLRQWEQIARSLSVAESEGMGGGEENKLGRVELAIALVEKQP